MKENIKTIFENWKQGVCHRGYHDLKRPENSKAAFVHALEHHLPFECDVHLSKDGVVVVSHDSDLSRMCGKPGIIEELTYEEIKADYSYFDGSAPITLEELLSLWDEQVGFVLELKTYQDNHRELAQAVYDLIKEKDPAKLILISFDARALRPFKESDFNLGLLIGQKKDVEYFHRHSHDIHEFDFLDVGVFFLTHFPMFQKYRKQGGSILVWTVQSEKDYKIATTKGDCPTWEVIRSNKPLEGQIEETFFEKKFHL